MLAAPQVVIDVGIWAAACSAAIGLVVTATALGARAMRRVIRDEVPRAMEAAIPDVTRSLVREEVDRAVEPHAASLRSELRQIRDEMRPNGGSSFSDHVAARFGSLEAGQRKIFAHIDATSGSMADTPDPEDTTPET